MLLTTTNRTVITMTVIMMMVITTIMMTINTLQGFADSGHHPTALVITHRFGVIHGEIPIGIHGTTPGTIPIGTEATA